MKRKATYSVSKSTRSKMPRLVAPLVRFRQNKDWVSATHTYNYMIKDPIVDWLKLNKKSCKKENVDDFVEFAKSCGIKFENKVVKYIHENICPVKFGSDCITTQSCERTTLLMHAGYPIIHSAPVRNEETKTQGIIDLLVRSDIINKIIDDGPLETNEEEISAPNLDKPYHYLVIDLKWSTLPLRSDGRHLLNSGRYPAYKAQAWIYNEAIGKIQGYKSPYAFIMGRRYRYKQKDIIYSSFNCLAKLGVINYQTIDNDYPDMTQKAIQWVRDVKTEGKGWEIFPPSRNELYPNMCVNSGIWQKEKEEIADLLGEITRVWYVGLKHRNIALANGINSWRDEKCEAANMNLNGVHAKTIDAIMSINRQNEDKILPKTISNNIGGWKNKHAKELFVDFETLSDVFGSFEDIPEQKKSDMIFMIGVGWEDEKGEFKYTNFTCKRPTFKEEYRVMEEFYNFVKERGFPPIYYWCAEKRFWSTAEARQFDIAIEQEYDTEKGDHITDMWKKITGWNDLCTVFKKEPIVIKDCFNYSLKNVAKTMYKHGMINTKLESNCDSGMTAMFKAWECYQTTDHPDQSDVMQDIAKYNKFDCEVLWDIVQYLRENHL